MAANNTKYVTAGKPKVGGAIFRAPAGSTLPTDASTALDAAFICLGYISDDGLTASTSRKSSDVKSWGNDTVLTLQTSYGESYQFTMLQVMDPEVQKVFRGDDNVTGDMTTGMTVKGNAAEDGEHCYVIEQILNGDVAFRTVIPSGKITEVEDITYADGDAVGYGVTLTCLPDASGNYHYEYYKKAE